MLRIDGDAHALLERPVHVEMHDVRARHHQRAEQAQHRVGGERQRGDERLGQDCEELDRASDAPWRARTPTPRTGR
jgi:hypothetical protein